MQVARWILRFVAAPLVVAVCVACATSAGSVESRAGRANGPHGGRGAEPSPPPWQVAQCTPIERFRKQPARHISVGSTYRHYDSSPPTSGPHWPISAGPGFYTVELPPEELVHNLEHGQIVIWYAPNIARGTQADLERLVTQHSSAFIAVPGDMVRPPYDFVLTAWGASQSCARYSRPVINRFRQEFQGHGPEDVGVPTFAESDSAA